MRINNYWINCLDLNYSFCIVIAFDLNLWRLCVLVRAHIKIFSYYCTCCQWKKIILDIHKKRKIWASWVENKYLNFLYLLIQSKTNKNRFELLISCKLKISGNFRYSILFEFLFSIYDLKNFQFSPSNRKSSPIEH